MEVALDGTHRAAQGLGKSLHLGPAQPAFVVGVVREGTICRDRLGWDTGEDEGLDLGDSGKSGLLSHRRLLFLVRRCALMIEFTKAAGLRSKRFAPPLFLCSFYWCVLYLRGRPRASPTPSRLVSLLGAPALCLRVANTGGGRETVVFLEEGPELLFPRTRET